MGRNRKSPDPSRTTALRMRFAARIRGMYKNFKRDLYKFLMTDPFGVGSPVVQSYQYDTSSRKVDRFRAYLRDKMDSDLKGDKVIQEYINQGYSRGATRTLNDIRRQRDVRSTGTSEPPIVQPKLRNQGATVEKVKLLASRTFTEMEGVNSRMATAMSRTLADGLVKGWGVDRIAKEISNKVDMEMSRITTVVKTELVRAHAEGQLDALEQEAGEYGVVEAEIEYSSVIDSVTCDECSSLEGSVFSVDEARGLIPVHPNCRCAWIVKER